jgi:hypothetical protein
MDALASLAKRVDDVEGRFTLIDHETDIENTSLWDAVMEIRRAINRLEQLHGVSAQTQWLVQAGGPRHPDAGPDLGA